MSSVSLTRSELTGESTFGLGDNRDLARGILGEKSWVNLPPKSVLAGCEMVSNMDIGKEGVACDRVDARKAYGARGSRTASSEVTYYKVVQITCAGRRATLLQVVSPICGTLFLQSCKWDR
jgi:hypothetical protein